MTTSLQMAFSNWFPWIDVIVLLFIFHCISFPRVQLIAYEHWFRSWLGAKPLCKTMISYFTDLSLGLNESKHYLWCSSQCMVIYLLYPSCVKHLFRGYFSPWNKKLLVFTLNVCLWSLIWDQTNETKVMISLHIYQISRVYSTHN